jgi:hypothetical protein
MKKLLTFVGIILLVACVLSSCEHIHNFDEWEIIKRESCTENGEKIRYCDCGETQTGIILATHREISCEAIAPTCTSPGLTEGKICSVCGHVIIPQRVIPMLNHNYKNGVCVVCSYKENNESLEDTIPSYWKGYLDGKIEEFNAKMQDLGGNADAFIFITDQHLDASTDYSAQLIRYIAQSSAINKVVFGGDTLAGSDNDNDLLQAYKDSFGNEALLLAIRGNHDVDGNCTAESFYNIMVKPLQGECNISDKLYYCYDNEEQKIRYIFTDSIASKSNNLTDDEQISWMTARILELESDWTVLIFHHGIWEGNTTSNTMQMSVDGQKIINAVDSVYDSAKCTIAGIYSGHSHRDYYSHSTKGYAIVSTATDSSNNAFSRYDINNPTRTDGTTTEQTFDIVIVDPKNHKIETIRIGAGENRTFTYATKESSEDHKKVDITDKFTWTPGAILYATGEANSNKSDYVRDWLYSNYVDVSSYHSITFSHVQTVNTSTVLGYAFYDENMNYICGESNGGGTYVTANKTVSVPENAKYFRVMWMNTTHTRYDETTYGLDNFYCFGNSSLQE